MTTTKTGRAIERARKAKKSDEVDEAAEAVRELRAEVTREEVRSLRRELDDLRGRLHDLAQKPGDPRITPRLVSRKIFERGGEILTDHRNLSARLLRLRRERREIDQRYERVRAELRAGGQMRDGTHPHPREDELRATLSDLNEELGSKADEIAETEDELDEIERELRGYVRIDSLPPYITRDVHEQE